MSLLTRYAVEKAIVSRLGDALADAGLAFTATPGAPNPDLNDPIAAAVEALTGGNPFPLDRTAVTDADLAALGPNLHGRFIDLATIQAVKSLVGRPTKRVVSRELPDLKVTYAVSKGAMIDLLKLLEDEYRRNYMHAGGVSVRRMCRQTPPAVFAPDSCRRPGYYGPAGYFPYDPD